MSKTLKWILVIFIALVILALGFFGGKYYLEKKNKKTQPTSTSTPTSTPSSTSSNSVPEEQAQNGEDWKIYKNFTHGFLIEYPDNAAVANGSSSEGEKDKAANEAYCIKISTKYYSVTVAARDIPADVFCLNTGFGTEWSNAPDETVTAAGQTYTAKGMVFQSASMGTYADDYTITTLSGEKIEYGIGVANNDDAMTKAQAKDIVHKIIASFSPAE